MQTALLERRDILRSFGAALGHQHTQSTDSPLPEIQAASRFVVRHGKRPIRYLASKKLLKGKSALTTSAVPATDTPLPKLYAPASWMDPSAKIVPAQSVETAEYHEKYPERADLTHKTLPPAV